MGWGLQGAGFAGCRVCRVRGLHTHDVDGDCYESPPPVVPDVGWPPRARRGLAAEADGVQAVPAVAPRHGSGRPRSSSSSKHIMKTSARAPCGPDSPVDQGPRII